MGHYARECRDGGDLGGMTRADSNYLPEWYEIALDNCSQVNVVNPRFLKNIRDGKGSYSGLAGNTKTTTLWGDLEGFFPCQVCETCAASVLCMSDVEALYPITYNQGVSYVVHMPGRDITFYKKNKIYLADFSDWITVSGLSMMTISEREEFYTKKEIRAATEAKTFIKNAGYPSEQEAINMIRDGNVTNVPIEVVDVKACFDIYGTPVESVRGKMTARKSVNIRDNYDHGLKEQRTIQDMTADIMHAGGRKYLVSISSPLELVISSPVASLGRVALGRALQDHLDVLRNFGFDARIVRVDPLKALAGLKGSFPGVEIDPSGAGDHLPKVDIRIRRIKEMARSIIAGLDYKLPSLLLDSLISFCVNRINTRRTTATTGNVCPRVKFTGRKVNYKKEFSLGFGDYCEARDPEAISNRIEDMRSQPCIALYPTGNINGSWKLFNVRTKQIVTRSVYKKMEVTSPIIIETMNQLAEGKEITTESLDAVTPAGVDTESNEDLIEEKTETEPPVRTHVPDSTALDRLEPEENENEEFDDKRAGEGSKRYEDYEQNFNLLTRGYGMALTTLKRKVHDEEYKKRTKAAIRDELIQLIVKKKALKAVKWTDLDDSAEVIASFMLLREKFDASGNFEKVKARLVGDGRMQLKNKLKDISAPTAYLESIFNSLKIIVEEDRKFIVLDVGGAFLNAMIDCLVYMILDPKVSREAIELFPELKEFPDDKGRLLVQIEKAMYGLIQSPMLWNETLTNLLKKNGFKSNKMDPCVWNRVSDGKQTTIVIYVDDLLISSERQSDIEFVKNIIEKEFQEIKIKEGNELSYLGMLLRRLSDGSIEVTMKGYIEEILKDWSNEELREYIIPADIKLFYTDDETKKYTSKKKFHKTVAQLLYLCKRGRPDVALPTHYLCTKVRDPSYEDYLKLKRVLGYLKSTLDKSRLIMKSKEKLRVTSYIDAAFAAHADGKSHSGGVVLVNGTMVEVITRKQKCCTRDSTEAELVALSDLVIDVGWHQEWYESQGYEMEKPLVYQDNTSTITLGTEGGGKMRNKRMRALQGVVLEGVEEGDYEIKYIPTSDMIADLLTKPLNGFKFHKFVKVMLGAVKFCRSKIKMAGVRCDNPNPGRCACS